MTEHKQIDIRINDFDEYEVVIVEPVVAGLFAKREHADLFYDALISGDAAVSGGVVNHADFAEQAEANLDATIAENTATSPAQENDAQAEVIKAQKKQLNQSAKEKLVKAKAAEPAAPDETDREQKMQGALKRCENGERLKTVAEETGIQFPTLRAKWAAGIKAGTLTAPKTEPPVRPRRKSGNAQPRDSDDSPVSGGVGAVLERSSRRTTFSDEQDTAILEASPDRLDGLAISFGMPRDQLVTRKKQLEAAATKLMQGGDDA